MKSLIFWLALVVSGGAVAAPESAPERTRGEGPFDRLILQGVMVVNGENKVEYREVTLGAPANGLRVVIQGLKPGERVVVNGLQHVRPGAVVEPTVVPMDAAQAKAQAAATKVAATN